MVFEYIYMCGFFLILQHRGGEHTAVTIFIVAVAAVGFLGEVIVADIVLVSVERA